MKTQEFTEYAKTILDEIEKRMITKGNEYSRNDNRFANFEGIARARQKSVPEVIFALRAKHEEQLQDAVLHAETPGEEWVWEKAIDNIIYTILAMAAWKRDRDDEAELLKVITRKVH